MIPKRVLAALAFLIVLLVFWQIDLRRQKTDQTRDKLLKVEDQNISAITFTGHDNDKIELIKKDGTWRMLEPVKTMADKWQIRNIIYVLDNAYLNKNFKSDDLSSFGIGKNRTITIGTKNGKSIKIRIGTKNPDQSSVYVCTDNKSVRMLSATIEKKIRPTLFELRAKNFVATDLADIREIKIESDKGDYIVIKDKNKERWRITSPVDEPADKYKASRFFADIAHLSASGFTPTDISKFDPPFLTLTITDKSGKTEKVIFGAQTKGGNRFVKSDIDGGRTGRVPSALFESIPLEYKNLLDKKIISFDPAKIKNILIDNGNKKYKLITTKEQGDNDNPAMADFVRYEFADKKEKIDQSNIGRYLIDLADYEYIKKEKPEKRTADKKLIIYFDDGSKTVIKGSKTGSRCHLVMNNKRYMNVDCALFPKIFPPKKEMTDRSLFLFENKDAEKIEVKIAGQKTSFMREGEAGVIMQNGNRVKLDRLKWNRFLWFLHSMTYDQIVTAKTGINKKETAMISIYNSGLELVEKTTFYESGTKSFAVGKNRYILPAGFAMEQLRSIINGLYFGYNKDGKPEQ